MNDTTATDGRPGADASTPGRRYGAALAGEIETKWQRAWEERGAFRQPNPGEPGFDASRPKFYCLDMFPYPSGAGLHVGHPEGYTATDIVCRYKRARGFNVLHPMGWDAFGLPAEQYAIQTGVHPAVTTRRAIENFRRQLKRFGFCYDWSREFATIDEDYYRWTQWIWLRLYDAWYDESAARARTIGELVAGLESGELAPGPRGEVLREGHPAFAGARPWGRMGADERREFLDGRRLAYLAEQTVNWCPKLGTVLANEEVIDGRSERGGHPVVRKPLRQWMFRITAFADRLLADLDGLDWPGSTKTMQAEWIGRSEGAHIDFDCGKRRIRVFTTRPDTLFGATYMVLAPEHPFVDELVPEKYSAGAPDSWKAAGFPGAEALVERGASPRETVEAYRAWVASRSDVDRQAEARVKSGVFTGAYAINPVNDERVPVFIADYVLMGYGTGAIMAVPAHDQRDFEFASQFGLPVRDVFYSRTLLAMKRFFERATEAEARSERWFWTLADFLGIVTSEETGPGGLDDALERARSRRADEDAPPEADVEPARLAAEAPGMLGSRRGAVRVTWMETIESIGFRSFAEGKAWFDDAEFFLRSGAAMSASGWAVNAPEIDGLTSEEAKKRVVEIVAAKGRGEAAVTYRLRDWLFSRQRYWGEPFPVVFDDEGRRYAIDESALPLTLPELEDYTPEETDEPTPLLGKATGWVRTTAGEAGVPADVLAPETPVTRETNTMPGWAGSCWYHLRYCDPTNPDRLIGEEADRYWLGEGGVDLYIGGAEHAVLHLLYARFWHKALHDLGHVASDEPYRRLFHQGLITSHAYQRADKSLVPVDEVDERAEGEFVERATGEPVTRTVAKMSKSLRNVVNPDDVIADYGADVFRLYEMYMGPLEASKPWNTRDIVGLQRFLQRVWRLVVDEETGGPVTVAEPDGGVERELHRAIAKVGEDIERLSFNTAIAAMIELVNAASKAGGVTADQAARLAQILAPFAPHLGEEIWSRLGRDGFVADAPWPEHDESMLGSDTVELPVQIGGKVRAKITVPADAPPADVEAAALANERVAEAIAGKAVRKVIVVPGRLVNIVAG